MPKLPELALPVSYSRITLGASLSRTSHTRIFPSLVVVARYCPLSLSAIAHTDASLATSAGTSLCGPHSPESGLALQILISPPKPALAATFPSLEVQRWWQPRGWAPLMVCARSKVDEVVSWTLMLEEPLAERTTFWVAAMAKMSVRWAREEALGGEAQAGAGDGGVDGDIIPLSTV